jgi:hypothetical protein
MSWTQDWRPMPSFWLTLGLATVFALVVFDALVQNRPVCGGPTAQAAPAIPRHLPVTRNMKLASPSMWSVPLESFDGSVAYGRVGEEFGVAGVAAIPYTLKRSRSP